MRFNMFHSKETHSMHTFCYSVVWPHTITPLRPYWTLYQNCRHTLKSSSKTNPKSSIRQRTQGEWGVRRMRTQRNRGRGRGRHRGRCLKAPPATCDWSVVLIEVNPNAAALLSADATTAAATQRDGHHSVDIRQHDGHADTCSRCPEEEG